MAIQSFDELLRGGVKKHGETSFVYEAKKNGFAPHSYNEFYIDIRKVADKLIKLGYGEKKIMLCGANSYMWAVCYMAVVAYVGIIVPIDRVWGPNDIANVLKDNDIALILCDESAAANIGDVKIPKIDLQDKTLLEGGGDEIHEKNIDDIHKILYTSGTTSKPKKVALTAKNLFANIDELLGIFDMSPNDRVLAIMPLHHITPVLSSLVYPLYLGLNLYIASDYAQMMKYLRKVKPTLLFAVPKVYEKILERLPKILRPLLPFLFGGKTRGLYSAAAVLKKDIIETYRKWGLPLLQGYGSTETSAIVSVELLKGYRLGSVGKVLPNQEVKIIEGEICVSGENIAKEFVGDDGYFHTGDLGYLDAENWLYFTGRKKQLIKLSNGKNVYPDELEELLLQCEDILSARVFEKDERIHASIHASGETAAKKAIEKTNDMLPPYMRIKSWEYASDTKSSYK